MWLHLLALASLACAQLQADAPWPAFMRNGQHTGATLDPGPRCAGPSLTLNQGTFSWRVPLPGGAHTSDYLKYQFYASQVSVSRNRTLYAASNNGNISAFQLGATPATTPSLLWTRTCGGAGCFFYFAPTLSEDGMLFVASMAQYNGSSISCNEPMGQATSTLFALNATTGATLWSRLFIGQVNSPVLTGGTMFVVTNLGAFPSKAAQRGARLSRGQCDSFLALNAADGSLRYSLPIGYFYDDWTAISPALSPDGGVVYVAGSDGLTALQAASGATLWVFSNSSDSRGTVGTSAPSVSTSGDTVYTSFNSYTNSAGSFIALDARTGAVRWWFLLWQGGPSCACPGGYATAASSSSTGDVYFSSTCGGLFALHANGTLKWAKCGLQPPCTTPFSIGAGDVLYFGTADRPIDIFPDVASGTVMAVDGASGTQLWAFQPTCDVNGTDNPCSSVQFNGYAGVLVQPPVVLNGSLLFAASGYLFALGSTAACPTAPPSPAAAGSSQGLSPGAVAGAVLGSLAAAGLLVAGWARCAKGAARSGGEEALLEGTFSSVAGE